MKQFRLISTAVVCAFLITACNEGPVETKGKELDKVVEKVQDKLQNKGPAQKAGEKIDDATGN